MILPPPSSAVLILTFSDPVPDSLTLALAVSGQRRRYARQSSCIMTRNAYLCSCNRTMPYDAAALTDARRAVGAARIETFDAMCQHQLARLGDAIEGTRSVQPETRLLTEVATDSWKVSTVRFFNLRGDGGLVKGSSFATPKLAALIASAMPDAGSPPRRSPIKAPDRRLIIGPMTDAVAVVNLLAGSVAVSVLATSDEG